MFPVCEVCGLSAQIELQGTCTEYESCFRDIVTRLSREATELLCSQGGNVRGSDVTRG